MAAETIANRGCDRNGPIRPSKMALPILVFASAVSQPGFVIANPILLDIARSFHLPLPVVARGQTLQTAGSAAMALAATLIAFGLTYAMRPSGVGAMRSLASLVGAGGMLSAAPLAFMFGQRRVLAAVNILGAAAIAIPLGGESHAAIQPGGSHPVQLSHGSESAHSFRRSRAANSATRASRSASGQCEKCPPKPGFCSTSRTRRIRPAPDAEHPGGWTWARCRQRLLHA